MAVKARKRYWWWVFRFVRFSVTRVCLLCSAVLFCLLNLCDDYWMWCNQRSSYWAGISQTESEPRSDNFNQEVLLWERGRGAPGMHTEKGSALSSGRRRRMVTLQVPHQSLKRTFSVVLTSDTVTTIYSNMKKNAAKNSRLETESHLICAPSTQSDDSRQVHPPL